MSDLPTTLFFGSCRVKVKPLPENFYLTRRIAGTHTPLETLQLMRYINEKDFKTKYLFSRVELKQINRKAYKRYYDQSEVIVVEVCSRKVYEAKNGDISLYEGAKLFRYELGDDKWNIKNLTDQEIEDYIIEIKNYISPKKLVLITHYRCENVGSSRDELIDLVIKIAKKHNIVYFEPSYIVKDKVNMENQNHYSEDGIQVYSNDIIKLLGSIK